MLKSLKKRSKESGMNKSPSQNWNVGGKNYCLPKYKEDIRIGRETAIKQES